MLNPQQTSIDNFPSVPDCIVTPEQYFDQLGKNRQLDPEKRLHFAVLEDAIRCIGQGKRTWECWAWIDATGLQPAPLTFEAVCEVLNIDPDWLRTLLHRHQDRLRQVPRRSPHGETKTLVGRGAPYQRLSGTGLI